MGLTAHRRSPILQPLAELTILLLLASGISAGVGARFWRGALAIPLVIVLPLLPLLFVPIVLGVPLLGAVVGYLLARDRARPRRLGVELGVLSLLLFAASIAPAFSAFGS